jgi:hypothetical protein
MPPVVYRRRRNALTRAEREWRVEEAALVTRGASGRERRLAWEDVSSVRLSFAPTRFKPWRYLFSIEHRDGRKTQIDNAHYLGFARFEDRSESYAPFVRAAVARIAACNPKARALIGETTTRYFFLLLAALLGLGGVAFVLVALPTPLDGLPFAGLIKLGLVLAMLPVFARWVLGAMPRGVALDAIPPDALPRVRGSS